MTPLVTDKVPETLPPKPELDWPLFPPCPPSTTKSTDWIPAGTVQVCRAPEKIKLVVCANNSAGKMTPISKIFCKSFEKNPTIKL
jgi:hypothetical protein